MAWAGLVLGLSLLACGSPKQSPTPSVGSNSNWLRACETDRECGGAQICRCGACTLDCNDDAACDALPNAMCVLRDDLALAASCALENASATFGVCLPRCDAGSCGEGQMCVEQSCVLAPPPVVAEPEPEPEDVACASLEAPTDTQRMRQDQLLALVLEERAGGGLMCTEEPAPASAPALRLDPRLQCAARLLAYEMNESGATNVVEDDARGTEETLRTVGYQARLWGVNYAMRADTPEHALRLMHNDRDTCRRFTNERFRDIGVANVGTTYIVTLAVSD